MMQGLSIGSAPEARRLSTRILRSGKRVVAAGVVTTAFLWGAFAWNPRPLGAQSSSYGEPAARFLKFGKTYINLSQVTHVVSDPDPALPPGSLQVHFGPHSLMLYGEDADSFRHVLEESGRAPAYQPRSTGVVAPPPRAAAPAPAPNPAASAVAKKPGVRRVPVEVP